MLDPASKAQVQRRCDRQVLGLLTGNHGRGTVQCKASTLSGVALCAKGILGITDMPRRTLERLSQMCKATMRR